MLILQRKFAMADESEPIVITNSEMGGSTPLHSSSNVQGQGLPTRSFGRGSVGQVLNEKIYHVLASFKCNLRAVRCKKIL